MDWPEALIWEAGILAGAWVMVTFLKTIAGYYTNDD